jgi:hypothetical protein
VLFLCFDKFKNALANYHLHLNNGGHIIETLSAAVHFCVNASSFEQALKESVKFAGPANYCVEEFVCVVLCFLKISVKRSCNCWMLARSAIWRGSGSGTRIETSFAKAQSKGEQGGRINCK